jgi:hypothetical protein
MLEKQSSPQWPIFWWLMPSISATIAFFFVHFPVQWGGRLRAEESLDNPSFFGYIRSTSIWFHCLNVKHLHSMVSKMCKSMFCHNDFWGMFYISSMGLGIHMHLFLYQNDSNRPSCWNCLPFQDTWLCVKMLDPSGDPSGDRSCQLSQLFCSPHQGLAPNPNPNKMTQLPHSPRTTGIQWQCDLGGANRVHQPKLGG